MTTLCNCWKITREDAEVYAFTDHDRDLTVGGVNYLSALGFVPSAVERSSDLTADNQTLAGIIDDATITAADLRTGKWDGARVEIIEVDWETATKERTLLVGFLGSVEIKSGQYSATLTSLEAELQKPIGRTVQLRCDADLGDSRCGYSLTADSATATVINNDLSFTATSLTAADAAYNGGKLTWTTGAANDGLTFDVKRYVAATKTIELYEPTPYTIQASDPFDIYLGCDKTMETCRDTFSNIDNFRAFPHLPGIKEIVAGNTTV